MKLINIGKQLPATGILRTWGKFRVLWSSSTFYIQALQFAMVLLLAYNDSIRQWIINIIGLEVPFGIFLVFVCAGYIVFCIFEHIISVPAINRYASEQFYEHGPFKDMDAKLDAVLKELAEMKKQKGRIS